jgi:hypothetical protein
MPFSLVLDALGLIGDGLSLYRKRQQAHASKIDRLLDEARAASGKEADTLLARVCEESARRVEKKPRDAHALRQWGVALWWRAAKTSGSAADQIYEQADQKFAQAQAIAGNDAACCADRVEALRYRAALHPGNKGRRLLMQLCDLCQKRLGIMWSGPDDARMLHTWGMALWWLAAREAGEEAKRLYKQADEKFSKAIALEPKEAEFAVDQADALVYAAALHGGDEQREMLQRVCQWCQQLASRGAGGARMLTIWGSALCWLGTISKGEEAERYYAEAEKKTARALRIAPDTERAVAGKIRSLTYRALLERGEARRNLLAQACEECVRFDEAHPRNADLLRLWGTVLIWRAVAADSAEAARLLADAAGKSSVGLSLRPADECLSTNFATALCYRAKVFGGEPARQWLPQAGELLEAVLNHNPANYEALTQWASVAHLRAKIMPGDETTGMASDLVRRFEAAAQNGANPDAILRGWGMALWTLARCVAGEESARLLKEAKAKLLEAETRMPTVAAFHLACFCAQTGELEECRRWLRVSGEPGVALSRDWVETEEEFAGVRDTEWFREMLAGQAG